MGFHGAFQFNFKTYCQISLFRQPLQIGTDTTAIFKYLSGCSVTGRFTDHRQAAFLAGPPDVGWLTAQGGFGRRVMVSQEGRSI
jgi:hypothetical protein